MRILFIVWNYCLIVEWWLCVLDIATAVLYIKDINPLVPFKACASLIQLMHTAWIRAVLSFLLNIDIQYWCNGRELPNLMHLFLNG